jgi:hypothetical protein
VHDILDILGVPDDASGREVRRACARRTVRAHPDFAGPDPTPCAPRRLADVAVDFVEMTVFVDAMQTDFFAHSR